MASGTIYIARVGLRYHERGGGQSQRRSAMTAKAVGRPRIMLVVLGNDRHGAFSLRADRPRNPLLSVDGATTRGHRGSSSCGDPRKKEPEDPDGVRTSSLGQLTAVSVRASWRALPCERDHSLPALL